MERGDAMRLGPRRDEVLDRASEMVRSAWRSFDAAREVEPPLDEPVLSLLAESLPERGRDPLEALADAELVLDRSLAQSRPRYLAYVGSSGLEVGAVADFLAHSYDINLAVDAGAASRLEEQTVAWLGEFLGFPAAAGSFTSGGTLSNLTALAAARERAIPASRREGLFGRRAALYCSHEAHYSVVRAAELLGLGSASVRDIAIDPVTRGMRPAELDTAIAADLDAGIVPIAVVATAGTTLTGAVDPMDEIADVCSTYGVWMHVDGAYGLPAAATSRAPLFTGLDRADSVSVDAHKWMFVPKACSAVLVRDPMSLVRSFSHDEAYIPHEDERPNSVDMTLEYSRPLRALKLWLAMRVHGAEEFRIALERNLSQAEHCYRLADADPEFEVLPTAPSLSIVPVRHVPPWCPDPDAHNVALTRAVIEDGAVYVSPAVIDGRQWLRPCFTNVRTTDRDVEVFLAVARRLGTALCPTH